jgi:ABC-type nitrate/sulfonate/bicarbonate transport system substrate-binding protein
MTRSSFLARIRHVRSGLLFALSAALLAAPSAGRGQAPTYKLTYAYSVSSPSLITESLYAAEKLGYLRRESLQVDVTWLQGDALALKSVLSNDADVAWVGTTAAIQAIARGAKVKIIYGPVPKSSNLIMAQKEVATIPDLKGKSIAVSSVGAISYHIPRIIMMRAGVDPNSANYVAIGSTSTRFQALAAKKVDAGMVDLIQDVEASERYPFLHSIASVAEKIPDLHFISVIASEKAIETKPEALRRLIRAELAGLKFLEDKPAEAANLSMDRLGAKNPANVVSAFEMGAKLKIYGVDGGLDPTALAKTVQLMIDMGDLKEAVPVDSLVDTKLLAAARKSP